MSRHRFIRNKKYSCIFSFIYLILFYLFSLNLASQLSDEDISYDEEEDDEYSEGMFVAYLFLFIYSKI